LKNQKNIEGEAANKEIMKLWSKVSRLRFDFDEKERILTVLENDFVESQSEVQKLTEEKNEAMELKGTMNAKITELETLNS
jgi:chromosome segregation ATPase